MADKIEVMFIVPIIGTYPTPVDPENPTAPELQAIADWTDRHTNSWGLYGKLLRNFDRIIVAGHDYTDIFYPDEGVEVSHPASPDVNGSATWFPTDWLARPSETASIADKAAWFDGKVADLRATYTLRGWATEDHDAELITRGYTKVTGGA